MNVKDCVSVSRKGNIWLSLCFLFFGPTGNRWPDSHSHWWGDCVVLQSRKPQPARDSLGGPRVLHETVVTEPRTVPLTKRVGQSYCFKGRNAVQTAHPQTVKRIFWLNWTVEVNRGSLLCNVFLAKQCVLFVIHGQFIFILFPVGIVTIHEHGAEQTRTSLSSSLWVSDQWFTWICMGGSLGLQSGGPAAALWPGSVSTGHGHWCEWPAGPEKTVATQTQRKHSEGHPRADCQHLQVQYKPSKQAVHFHLGL